jgi:hypothetical protein
MVHPMTARISTLVLAALAALLLAADAKPPAGPYSNDFQSVEPGKPPDEFFILNGQFTVAEEASNRFLELAGDPLDTFGLLFGPEGQARLDVSARIGGTSSGRLTPEFGIGTNDAGGYKLWLVPNQHKLQLRKGDDPTPKAEAPYKDWQSGQWTALRIRVTDAGGGRWKIEGKAWQASGKEPEAWAVTMEDNKPPSPGRASLWGIPYSETPIRFDDLKVTPTEPGK